MEHVHSFEKGGEFIDEPAWYCLRTQPKREHIAAARLRRLQGVTVLFSRVRFKRATCRGPVWVTEAMFPGYLFARFKFSEKHREVRYAHGVAGIVRFADRYPTIREEMLEPIRVHSADGEVLEIDQEPSPGSQVRIVKGAFSGLDAVVTQVLSAGERVKVLMDFLGRQLEAEVECSSLLPQAIHPLAV
jgi:transcriptional antiterminator RfaH